MCVCVCCVCICVDCICTLVCAAVHILEKCICLSTECDCFCLIISCRMFYGKLLICCIFAWNNKTLRQIHRVVVTRLSHSLAQFSIEFSVPSLTHSVLLRECCTRTGWHPGAFHLHFEIESFVHLPTEQETRFDMTDIWSVPNTVGQVDTVQCVY